MRYVISLPASRDLQAIADYFAQVNIAAGERFLDEFERRCQQIVSFPNSGRSYSEFLVPRQEPGNEVEEAEPPVLIPGIYARRIFKLSQFNWCDRFK